MVSELSVNPGFKQQIKHEIEATIATMARIPPKSVSTDDKKTLETLEGDLKRVVFGQDTAIEVLASAIKLSRAGLRDPDKPIGNYLFSGPTGVGKTEVARQLASIMGIPLQRFDMSEYMERHSVSRLIGAPPGYVGYDQGGLLTDAIDQQPHCVLLLDEIEKAHPDLFNILLQVMDNGRLTDHHGKTVDFRNVILIMTTNAGASDMARESIGFGTITREDGSIYESGSVFEFEDALAGFRSNAHPEMLLYRKGGSPMLSLGDKAEVLERLDQMEGLQNYVERVLIGEDGSYVAAFHMFDDAVAFETMLEMHLRKLVERILIKSDHTD